MSPAPCSLLPCLYSIPHFKLGGVLENALTLSQEEKEELERDYQEQKQKLEQELALSIK